MADRYSKLINELSAYANAGETTIPATLFMECLEAGMGHDEIQNILERNSE